MGRGGHSQPATQVVRRELDQGLPQRIVVGGRGVQGLSQYSPLSINLPADDSGSAGINSTFEVSDMAPPCIAGGRSGLVSGGDLGAAPAAQTARMARNLQGV